MAKHSAHLNPYLISQMFGSRVSKFLVFVIHKRILNISTWSKTDQPTKYSMQSSSDTKVICWASDTYLWARRGWEGEKHSWCCSWFSLRFLKVRNNLIHTWEWFVCCHFAPQTLLGQFEGSENCNKLEFDTDIVLISITIQELQKLLDSLSFKL